MKTSSKLMLYGLITVPVILIYAIVTDGIQAEWEFDILMPIFWSGVISFGIGFLWPDGEAKVFSNEGSEITEQLKLKVCNQVGKSVHKQMTDALKVNGEAFADPKEAVFFYAYLDQLVFRTNKNAVIRVIYGLAFVAFAGLCIAYQD